MRPEVLSLAPTRFGLLVVLCLMGNLPFQELSTQAQRFSACSSFWKVFLFLSHFYCFLSSCRSRLCRRFFSSSLSFLPFSSPLPCHLTPQNTVGLLRCLCLQVPDHTSDIASCLLACRPVVLAGYNLRVKIDCSGRPSAFNKSVSALAY